MTPAGERLGDAPRTSSTRLLFSVAAALALAVTVIFATIGDGVDAPEATGLRALIVAHAHTLVWLLLTVAFVIAAVCARWTRLAGAIALASAALYATFLIAVFLWR